MPFLRHLHRWDRLFELCLKNLSVNNKGGVSEVRLVCQNQLPRRNVPMKDTNAKPKNVDYFQVPEELWQLIKHNFATPSV